MDALEAEFKAKYPNRPLAKPIECLNLVMRKQYAMQVLRGEKKLEFRGATPFYHSRLLDQDVCNWMVAHDDDSDVAVFTSPIRQVKKIHFHNYNNSWHLDVECTFNEALVVRDDSIGFIREKYGCTDFDDMLKDLNARKVEGRPMYFYFVCGKVLDTNLSLDEK